MQKENESHKERKAERKRGSKRERQSEREREEKEEEMQKAVESDLPSASVHSLFFSFLTVSLVVNQEERVEEDKKEVFSSSLTLCPSSPTVRPLSFL